MTQMAETTQPLLPAEFADLAPFAAKWCLPTEHERFAMRLASTMDEMQVFYDAITPRADEAMNYCDNFALDELPEDATNLLHMLYSMIAVSFPVECWGQPHVPDTGAAYLDLLVEPGP
ncbi:MAG TPA: hypothetical protein VMF35_12300 [Acidimicrobiales bacterium]|nr:hypothetical protein [Acidimicrobiales bacterium]